MVAERALCVHKNSEYYLLAKGLLDQPCVSVRFNIQRTFVSTKPWLVTSSPYHLNLHTFPQFTYSQHVGSLFSKHLLFQVCSHSPKNYKNDSNLYKDANQTAGYILTLDLKA